MSDIANIGFKADTSELKKAKADLSAIVPAAESVSKAAAKVDAALTGAGAAGSAAAGGIGQAGAAARGAAGSMGDAGIAAFRMGEGYDLLTGKMNKNFLAINNNIAAMRNSKADIAAVGAGLRLNAREGLNFSRQFADIGVTAAMGMNPLMIAIQQGPQLFDILQEKAIATGTTIGVVAKAAGAQFLAAFAPFLPIILAIGVAVGVVAGAFALLTRSINKSGDDVTQGLGLTEKQLERVKEKGVETGVTLGDTFSAFFSVLGERIAWLVSGPMKVLSDAWGATMDFITKYGYIAIKGIIGGFVGAVYAIKASWSLLPRAIGDVAIVAANATISAVETMINWISGKINAIVAFAETAAAKVGLSFNIGQIGETTFGRLDNPFAGAAKEAGAAAAQGFGEGMNAAGGAIDRFFSDVRAKARQNAVDRVQKAAGKPEAGKKDPKAKAEGKTDAEKEAERYDALMQRGQAYIRQKNAEAAALGLTAFEAAKLKHQTDLLSDAERSGIKITEARRKEIEALAAGMAKADVAFEKAKWVDDFTKSHEEAMRTLKAEQGELFLSGVALRAYRIEQEMLNDAIRRKIDLTEEDRAAIKRNAAEQAAMGEQIARTREAIGEAKATIKGFFMDFYNDVRQGKNVFKALADAFVGAIDRMIEKLLDRTLDKLLDDLFSQQGQGGGGGGILGAIIGAFGGASGGGSTGSSGGAWKGGKAGKFADGGAFTNGVYSRPTMFSFAKGTALGEMGEAGPEAVMPLSRGPDGALGVKVQGARRGTGGASGPAQINITNEYILQGAMSGDDVIGIVKAGAEQTKTDVKRQLNTWIGQLNSDGAIV